MLRYKDYNDWKLLKVRMEQIKANSNKQDFKKIVFKTIYS